MESSGNIKELRKSIRLSQADFAKCLGYSQGYVADLERGRQKPSREFLEKIKKTFGVSSDYILYGSPPDQVEEGLAGHPEEYAEKMKEAMIIREPESKYQILPTATKKLIDNMVEILQSDNEVMIDALKANIKAFLEAVRLKKKNDEDKSKGGDKV